MRVIAGVARGRRLAPVPGGGTRPITDRAKESLFAILTPEMEGARVLDLFAGTGAVGIEALSRGAAEAWFVEKHRRAVATIRRNLESTGLGDGGRVVQDDVFRFLAAAPRGAFDVVYVAPPQYMGLWSRTLGALDEVPPWVASGGVIVVQIHPREEEALALESFAVADRRQYGSVRLVFYRPVGGPGR